MSQRTTRGAYRRTKWAAVAGAGAMAITLYATPGAGAAPAQAALAPGQGLAIAQTERVDPRSGNLSIGITFGISIGAHQNSVAQASSQAIDLGVIGTTLAAQGCDGSDPTLRADKQPQPLQVDSRGPNTTGDADESAFPVPIHKHASANPDPFAESVTTTAPLGIAGVLQIGQGVATSHSGLIEGGTVREAKAITDISGITFPGGISMSGLHWEVTSRSDGPAVGTFTIGHATGPLGQPIPTDDPSTTIDQINQALAALGLKIDPPAIRQAGGAQFVDPMGISVVPNTQRDAVAGAITGAVQPIRKDLFDALLAQSCTNATYITIADIVLGSITGAGAFHINLGGVQASSGEIAANPFKLLGPGGLSGGSIIAGTPGTPGTHGSGTSAGVAAGGTTAGAAPATGGQTATVPASSLAAPLGKRGGALAGVGLGTLALLGLLAEGDRRKMRRAQREIPVFED